MRRLPLGLPLSLALCVSASLSASAFLGLPSSSAAQEASAAPAEAVVLVVDPGQRRINIEQLRRSIEVALSRPVVRLSDPRASSAESRLMIAHQAPRRWVVRYEARGNVSWVSSHIDHPGRLRAELAELSQRAVAEVEQASPTRASASGAAAGEGVASAGADPAPSASLGTPQGRREDGGWDAIIDALRDELIDPFEGEHRTERPTAFLWSEILDPFGSDAVPHAQPATPEVWGDVIDPMLDPWSDGGARPRR